MRDVNAEQGSANYTGIELRRLFGGMLAAFVFGVVVSAAVHRSIEDATLVFVNAPHHIVPDGHTAQVKVVRTIVPRGSTVFYIMDRPEAWQIGLWQRSLYPEYVLLPIQGRAQLQTIESRRLRQENGIQYAISAGNPPIDPAFKWHLALSSYPNAIPTIVGKLPPE